MYREVSEDLLYVQLNLLLAILICTNINNNYIQSNNKFNLATFTIEMEELINKHIKEHYESYSCLQDIREYQIKLLDGKSIKYLYDNMLKEDIEYKEFKTSIREKLKRSIPLSLMEETRCGFNC